MEVIEFEGNASTWNIETATLKFSFEIEKTDP